MLDQILLVQEMNQSVLSPQYWRFSNTEFDLHGTVTLVMLDMLGLVHAMYAPFYGPTSEL